MERDIQVVQWYFCGDSLTARFMLFWFFWQIPQVLFTCRDRPKPFLGEFLCFCGINIAADNHNSVLGVVVRFEESLNIFDAGVFYMLDFLAYGGPAIRMFLINH